MLLWKEFDWSFPRQAGVLDSASLSSSSFSLSPFYWAARFRSEVSRHPPETWELVLESSGESEFWTVSAEPSPDNWRPVLISDSGMWSHGNFKQSRLKRLICVSLATISTTFLLPNFFNSGKLRMYEHVFNLNACIAAKWRGLGRKRFSTEDKGSICFHDWNRGDRKTCVGSHEKNDIENKIRDNRILT